MTQNAPWLEIAMAEIGTKEIKGKKDNPRVMEYLRASGQDWARHDEVPWCAAFTGWCLEQSGATSTNSLMARSYSRYGVPLEKPVPGCIVVLKRGNPPSGHVGFYLGKTGTGRIKILGGNQSNQVSITTFPKRRVIAYRWPDQPLNDTPKLVELKADPVDITPEPSRTISDISQDSGIIKTGVTGLTIAAGAMAAFNSTIAQAQTTVTNLGSKAPWVAVGVLACAVAYMIWRRIKDEQEGRHVPRSK